jgi:hypothetical protein
MPPQGNAAEGDEHENRRDKPGEPRKSAGAWHWRWGSLIGGVAFSVFVVGRHGGILYVLS